tara:strand:- start:17 stop:196 length:180 start_codon:yes stop_codon:yes gene_type:complete
MKLDTHLNREDYLTILNAIDFAIVNDASFEEYADNNSVINNLEPLRDSIYTKFMQLGGH